MRTLIFILIITGCFCIGYLSKGTIGVLALFLSFLSFVLGIAIYADVASEKALNGELLEVKKKYYELKYVKDKVE
mgnify:CR=1 FL=1|jgi:hypothetical protein